MPVPSTSRDFVGYGEHPPEFRWPGDARVAVSLVINVEDGAERSIARGAQRTILEPTGSSTPPTPRSGTSRWNPLSNTDQGQASGACCAF
ncbi:polysaccharide deacetylase [Arthrobacter sp. Hiyo8]|nr:polysaccharide deacetylase [Arthrobacter sp. Hiyo8]